MKITFFLNVSKRVIRVSLSCKPVNDLLLMSSYRVTR